MLPVHVQLKVSVTGKKCFSYDAYVYHEFFLSEKNEIEQLIINKELLL
jgi:hypothetical protein